jgi:pyrroline-5-carboxylate reductase
MEISKTFFVGSGNMAQAIISGLLGVGFVKTENIVCNDIVKEKILNIQKNLACQSLKIKANP